MLCKVEDKGVDNTIRKFHKKYSAGNFNELDYHVTTYGKKGVLLKMGGFTADNIYIKCRGKSNVFEISLE